MPALVERIFAAGIAAQYSAYLRRELLVQSVETTLECVGEHVGLVSWSGNFVYLVQIQFALGRLNGEHKQLKQEQH